MFHYDKLRTDGTNGVSAEDINIDDVLIYVGGIKIFHREVSITDNADTTAQEEDVLYYAIQSEELPYQIRDPSSETCKIKERNVENIDKANTKEVS